MFTDIVASTETATHLGDSRWRRLLDEHDRISRDAVTRYSGRIVKSTGDGVLATFAGPSSAVAAGEAVTEGLGTIGLAVRVGIHTGEVELRGDDIGGLAVHVAARINQLAAQGEILVSSTVRDLTIGSGIALEPRGVQQLKGIDRPIDVYAVTNGPDKHPWQDQLR